MSEAPFLSALLVEDEPQLAITLKIAFRKLGISPLYAPTLSEAGKMIQQHHPDFILLDRTLPDGDGIDFCTQLRNEGYTGTILMLTASGGIEDRVKGLNAGADDYLPKPFSWEELEARVRALSRRRVAFSPQKEKSPLWQLDQPQLRILGPKGWVQLTPLEFKLAAELIKRQDTIISRGDLLKQVWGFTLLPKTRTVDHFLGRLRKHFEQDSEKPVHFLTIRGAGYKFKS